jgi:hypothetical protein
MTRAFASQDSADFISRGSGHIGNRSGVKPLHIRISDFLWADGLEEDFRKTAMSVLSSAPIMLLAQSEREPDWKGGFRLTDSESPKHSLDLMLTEDIVKEYQKRLRRHEEEIETIGKRYGASLLRLTCPDTALTPAACEALAKEITRQGIK